MGEGRATTLSQVAARAGVSLATASKVINDTGRISEPTRARVRAAAEELRFVPNPHARSLHTGRTSIVGALILDSTAQRFAMPLIIGADAALSEINLAMIACDAKGDPARARELVDMLRRRYVDGLIVIGEHQGVWASLSHEIDRPVIYVHGETDDPADTVFLADGADAMRQLVEHLVGLGRRRLLYITGPREARAVRQRDAGLLAAVENSDARLLAPPAYGAWSQRTAGEIAAELLAAHPDVDAIVCGSDQLAAGVVQSVAATGRRIPDDIALTGFDNWSVFADETQPPLTTIDMNIGTLGAVAARALGDALGGSPIEPGVHLQPCTLIARGSTLG